MRPIKYPTAQLIGRRCGRKSEAYLIVLALEQWAAAHGYKGYTKHNKRNAKEKALQMKIKEV